MVLPVDHLFLLAGCLELWHFATAFHIYCLQTSSLCLCHSLNPVKTGYGVPCVRILTTSFRNSHVPITISAQPGKLIFQMPVVISGTLLKSAEGS